MQRGIRLRLRTRSTHTGLVRPDFFRRHHQTLFVRPADLRVTRSGLDVGSPGRNPLTQSAQNALGIRLRATRSMREKSNTNG